MSEAKRDATIEKIGGGQNQVKVQRLAKQATKRPPTKPIGSTAPP